MSTNNHDQTTRYTEDDPMLLVAADQLVNFASGRSSRFQETSETDGLTALEIARTVSLCLTEAAS